MSHEMSRRGVVARLIVGLAMVACSLQAQTILWESIGPSGAFHGSKLFPLDDVNGDGIDEVLISNYLSANGPTFFEGYIGVLSGADGSVVHETFGPAMYEGLQSAGSLGDVDGDGAGDYVAYSLSIPAEIRSGATGLPIVSLPSAIYLAAAKLGDIDGNGFDEYILPGGVLGPVPPGAGGGVTVYTGPNLTPLFSAYGNSNFGYAIAPCGDVSGDGTPDFIVGAPGFGVKSTFVPGWAYVCSGADGSQVHMWTGPYIDSLFGSTVAGVGDIDGDGVPDLHVGQTDTGISYLYSGATGNLITNLITAFYPHAVGLGDLNRDGYGDFALHDQGCDVRIYSGALMALLGEIDTDSPSCHRDFEFVGDIDGDGYPDVVAGESALNALAPPEGAVRAYSLLPQGVMPFGGPCSLGSGDVPLIGMTGPPQLGASFTLNLSGVPSGTPALLMIGFSNTIWDCAPLPLDLSSFGMPACELLVSLDLLANATVQSLATEASGVSLTFAIPLDPSYGGLTLYAQWAVASPPGASTLGAMSGALEITSFL